MVVTRKRNRKQQPRRNTVKAKAKANGGMQSLTRTQLNALFRSLDRLTARRVGEYSLNATVRKLQLITNHGDVIQAVLKSSRYAKADSLVYEWFVGTHCIQALTRRFPCFLETYALVHLPTYTPFGPAQIESTYQRVVATNPNVCDSNVWKQYALLLQYVPHSQSLNHWVKHGSDITTRYGSLVEWAHLILQVYLPLSMLLPHWVHNDLHDQNVLLYQLPNNQHVVFHYPAAKVTCKTRWIVKIIDYGRCFFDSTVGREHRSSTSFLHDLQQQEHCHANAPGYQWLYDEGGNIYHIDLTHANVSIDLQLFTTLIPIALKRCYQHNSDPASRHLTHLMNQLDHLVANKIPSQRRCKPRHPLCNVATVTQAWVHYWNTHADQLTALEDEWIHTHHSTCLFTQHIV